MTGYDPEMKKPEADEPTQLWEQWLGQNITKNQSRGPAIVRSLSTDGELRPTRFDKIKERDYCPVVFNSSAGTSLG